MVAQCTFIKQRDNTRVLPCRLLIFLFLCFSTPHRSSITQMEIASKMECSRRLSVGPRDVLRLNKPTNGFLCPLTASEEHGISFLSFTIRDEDTKQLFFHVDDGIVGHGYLEQDYESDCLRAIKYSFR